MNSKSILVSFCAAIALSPSAFATFHLMQVEQVIGGLDGDTTAQAIQLRMRADDQEAVSQARVRAWDATGNNPVLILNIASDVVVSTRGSRVLLATAAFTTAVQAIAPAFSPDFTMTNPIPASYLAAGRLTFESDSGIIYWSLAWGGVAYTGSNSGTLDNDANGNFGPPFELSLPSSSRRGVVFNGLASALSTANAIDYRLSANPATVTRNDNRRFVIGTVPEIVIDQPLGNHLVDGASTTRFGRVKVGQTGPRKVFTIRNVGNAPLTGLKIGETNDKPNEFIVSALGATSLAPGEKTTFKVGFRPARRGVRDAAIHVRSNDANENPFDIKLIGQGVKLNPPDYPGGPGGPYYPY